LITAIVFSFSFSLRQFDFSAIAIAIFADFAVPMPPRTLPVLFSSMSFLHDHTEVTPLASRLTLIELIFHFHFSSFLSLSLMPLFHFLSITPS
jgi:hypothetical protein